MLESLDLFAPPTIRANKALEVELDKTDEKTSLLAVCKMPQAP